MTKPIIAFAYGLLLVSSASALPVTITGANRTASLDGAIDGTGQSGDSANPNATLIGSTYGGVWVNQGVISSGVTNDLLTLSLTSGNFGSTAAGGTWTIDPSYWSAYGAAVISFHVGQGGGSPDWFAWKISPGVQTGSWSYSVFSGAGGGFSNMQLFTSNPQVPSVPDAANTLALLGGVMIGLAMLRRAVVPSVAGAKAIF